MTKAYRMFLSPPVKSDRHRAAQPRGPLCPLNRTSPTLVRAGPLVSKVPATDSCTRANSATIRLAPLARRSALRNRPSKVEKPSYGDSPNSVRCLEFGWTATAAFFRLLHQAGTTRSNISSGWESAGLRVDRRQHPWAAAAPWGSSAGPRRPSYRGCEFALDGLLLPRLPAGRGGWRAPWAAELPTILWVRPSLAQLLGADSRTPP